MPYIPNTDDDRLQMLDAIGVSSFDELIASIPSALRLNHPLAIPSGSEMEVLNEVASLASENTAGLVCFAGGGVYDHFIPAAVGAVVSRPEFVTAYTPYQPEVAQGTLQAIYEFQTHICRLTGMDVANASMYDGASAAAEALTLACRVTRRNRVVISETVNPLYREVISTYLAGRELEMVTAPMVEGLTDFERLEDILDDKTAGLLVGQPNFFGLIEEMDTAAELIHKVGGKFVMTVDPIAQAILKTPADYGADVVVGEGQPLGNPLSYGGPLLGFFAARKELARAMPGRIAARTKDVDGNPGFVLTLQTREQHIRRDKATSNICTNQALCATTAAVYMSLLGKAGMKEVALLSAERALETSAAIRNLDAYEPYFKGAFVREFPVKTPVPAGEIVSMMIDRGVLPGIDAGRWYDGMNDCLIVAATEKRSSEEILNLAAGLKEVAARGVVSEM